MSGNWGEIYKTLKRHCIERKGQCGKIGSGFKFLWSGGCKAENYVVVIVANWLIGKVVKVERYSNRLIKVYVVIGDVFWEVLSTGW